MRFSIRKVVLFLLMAALCVGVAGCTREKEPDPSKLKTPQYNVAEPTDFVEPPAEEVHTSEQGVKVILPLSVSALEDSETASGTDAMPMATRSVTPETVWQEDSVATYNAFTLPEVAAFDDGSIGVLSI